MPLISWRRNFGQLPGVRMTGCLRAFALAVNDWQR
jgi:hypothetical protein